MLLMNAVIESIKYLYGNINCSVYQLQFVVTANKTIINYNNFSRHRFHLQVDLENSHFLLELSLIFRVLLLPQGRMISEIRNLVLLMV